MQNQYSPVGDAWRTLDATFVLSTRYLLDNTYVSQIRDSITARRITLDDGLTLLQESGETALDDQWDRKAITLFTERASRFMPNNERVRQLYSLVRKELRMCPIHAMRLVGLLLRDPRLRGMWAVNTSDLKCIFDVTDQTFIPRMRVLDLWESLLPANPMITTSKGSYLDLFVLLDREVQIQLERLADGRPDAIREGYASKPGPNRYGFTFFSLNSILPRGLIDQKNRLIDGIAAPAISTGQEVARVAVANFRTVDKTGNVLQQLEPLTKWPISAEVETIDMDNDDWAERDVQVLDYLRREFDAIRARSLEMVRIINSGEGESDLKTQSRWLAINALEFQRLRDGLGSMYRLIRILGLGPNAAAGLVSSVDMPADQIIAGVRATMAAGRLGQADALTRFAVSAPMRLTVEAEVNRMDSVSVADLAFQTSYYRNAEAAQLLRSDLEYRYKQIVESDLDRVQIESGLGTLSANGVLLASSLTDTAKQEFSMKWDDIINQAKPIATAVEDQPRLSGRRVDAVFRDSDGTQYEVTADPLGVKRYRRLMDGQLPPIVDEPSPDELLAHPNNIKVVHQFLVLPVKSPTDCPSCEPLTDAHKRLLASWLNMDRTRPNYDKLLAALGDVPMFIYDDNGQQTLLQAVPAPISNDPDEAMRFLGDPFYPGAEDRRKFIEAWGVPVYDACHAALFEAAWIPHGWRAAMFMWTVPGADNNADVRQELTTILPELAAIQHGDQLLLAKVTTRHAFIASEVIPQRHGRQQRESPVAPLNLDLDDMEAAPRSPRRQRL